MCGEGKDNEGKVAIRWRLVPLGVDCRRIRLPRSLHPTPPTATKHPCTRDMET